MNTMQACLNDVALKAIDNSYIGETFSTVISCRKEEKKNRKPSEGKDLDKGKKKDGEKLT